MLMLSLKFWRTEGGTSFVSRSNSLIFHSTEIKKTSQSSAMYHVTQYVNILNTHYTFCKLVRVWEAFLYVIKMFPIHSYGDIFNFGSAAASAVQCIIVLCISGKYFPVLFSSFFLNYFSGLHSYCIFTGNAILIV